VENFFKTMKLSFGNIENAPLNLPPIHLSEQSTTAPQILKQISARYTREGLFSLLKVMGSFNIIGNPVALFVNLGTGIWDFVDKPMTGFVKGPLEGSYGLLRGLGSLVRHSFSGVFNSIESITDSVGSGLSHLSLDNFYVLQRTRIK
jgi:vacuolar protein sorting-associated protein 13A/C